MLPPSLFLPPASTWSQRLREQEETEEAESQRTTEAVWMWRPHLSGEGFFEEADLQSLFENSVPAPREGTRPTGNSGNSPIL